MERVQQLETEHKAGQTGKRNVKKSLYLYCVVSDGNSDPDDFTINGIEDKPLSTIKHRDIGLVVSEVESERQQATRNNLLRHAEVLEKIMRHRQILPIRFGIVASNQEEVVNVLKTNYWNFSELLDKLRDKKELGLKIILNQSAVLKQLVDQDKQIRELRDSLVGRSDNGAYHDKIKLGRMVDAALSHWRSELTDEVFSTLAPLADEHRENKLLTDDMILNSAFLVPVENEPEFDKRLDSLGEKYDGLLIFKYTNVTPPYNFINLAIKL